MLKLVILTTATLVAFAANSLLCRFALGEDLIDPLSFTTIRLVSGALALFGMSFVVGEPRAVEPATTQGALSYWLSGLALFAYAVAFSLAYVSLSAGTGALILFGAVQATMIGWGVKSGEKLGVARSLGFAAAIAGLVYLVLPGISAPDPNSALSMGLAGVAWGVYSIRGKGVVTPVNTTASNFACAAATTLAMTLAVRAFMPATIQVESRGAVLALISGVLTSGLGYVLWYKALPGLTTTQASCVQLTVPVIAAAGGVAFLSEQVSLRLFVASALILGGVAVVILVRSRPASPSSDEPSP